MSLGENIRNARLKIGISQKDLAEALSYGDNCVSNTSVSNWENDINKPDADTLAHLCKILNVDANYLLNYDEIKKERDNNIDFGLLNQYKILFDKDYRLTKEQKKFFMDFLEERHKRIDEKEEKGS